MNYYLEEADNIFTSSFSCPEVDQRHRGIRPKSHAALDAFVGPTTVDEQDKLVRVSRLMFRILCRDQVIPSVVVATARAGLEHTPKLPVRSAVRLANRGDNIHLFLSPPPVHQIWDAERSLETFAGRIGRRPRPLVAHGNRGAHRRHAVVAL